MDIDQLSFLIVKLMDSLENIEDYLKENLGSDWKILKNTWQKYKDGEATKWEVAKAGISRIGDKFISIFI